MKGQKVEQFPERADTGVAEDLAPKPAPTPTATTDPFGGDEEEQDNLQIDCGFGPCEDDEDGIVSVDPNNQQQTIDDGSLLGGGAGYTPASPQQSPARRETR